MNNSKPIDRILKYLFNIHILHNVTTTANNSLNESFHVQFILEHFKTETESIKD